MPEKKDIDWELVIECAKIHCTQEETCSLVRVDLKTLHEWCPKEQGMKFPAFWKYHRNGGKMSLRRAQYQAFMEPGNNTMKIWLGKQWLKQKDKHEVSGDRDAPIAFEAVTESDLDYIIAGGNVTTTEDDDTED